MKCIKQEQFLISTGKLKETRFHACTYRCSSKESKRKSTLKKKAGELATLCDVRVCMVCFGPDESKVEAWPENKTEVLDVINMYYKGLNSGQKGKQDNKAKQDDLFGFLESKKENNLDQEEPLNNKGKEPADINQENTYGNNKYWDEIKVEAVFNERIEVSV